MFFRALALGLLSSFFILSLRSNSLVIEARDTKLVVVLVGTLLDSKFEDRYELTTSELSNVSCSGAKIENAQIKNVSGTL